MPPTDVCVTAVLVKTIISICILAVLLGFENVLPLHFTVLLSIYYTPSGNSSELGSERNRFKIPGKPPCSLGHFH